MSKSASLFSAADELTPVVGQELAEAFIEMRRAIKHPITGKGAALMAARLRRFPDPKASVENSIMNSWSNCYEVKPERQSEVRSTTNSPASLFTELGDYYRAQSEAEGDGIGQAVGLFRDLSVKPVN